MKQMRCLKKGVTQHMHRKMSHPTKDEVMIKRRARYARAGQKHKARIID